MTHTFDLLNVALKVEWCLCYFMICCRIGKGTPGLNMNGHQKTIGKRSIPVSFLTHQMNHSRKSNRLVINFNKRKSSIIFPEFGYFLGKKTERKTFRLKKYGFLQLFRSSLFINWKWGNRKCVLYHSRFFSCRDFITTESNQNFGVEYNSY